MVAAPEVQVQGLRGAPAVGMAVNVPMTRPAYPRDYPQTQTQRGVYLAYTDLCEIGYELAHGFLRYAPGWGYWCLASDPSWLQERPFYRPRGEDAAFVQEIVRTADVVQLCEYHNFWDALGGPFNAVDPSDLKRDVKVAIHHHGCAYRDDPLKFERAEIDARYLRLVSTPDLLIHGSPEGRKTLRWLPSPINVTEIERNYPRGLREGPLVIGHGYTVAANKGSDFICETVRGMRQAPALKIMHGLQRRESLWHIRQCDVYVATMLYGPGMASLEAMAMGIPVVLGCTPDELVAQKECYGEDLPFIHVTERTLERKLKMLIADEPMRRAWGEKGRKAVRRLHDVPAVVGRLKAMYEGCEPVRRIVRA